MKETTENIYKWLEIGENEFGDTSKLPLAISLVEEELQELKDGIKNKDRKEVINAIVDLWWVLCNVSLFSSVTVDELQKEFDKVEKSNFSKYCKTFEEAQETVNAYANGTHPNKLGEIIETYIVSTKYTEYPFVVKRKDEKVLKSINFKDVNEF